MGIIEELQKQEKKLKNPIVRVQNFYLEDGKVILFIYVNNETIKVNIDNSSLDRIYEQLNNIRFEIAIKNETSKRLKAAKKSLTELFGSNLDEILI